MSQTQSPTPQTAESTAGESTVAESSTELTFHDLALHPSLMRAVEELGYEQPTPIQAGAIPLQELPVNRQRREFRD